MAEQLPEYTWIRFGDGRAPKQVVTHLAFNVELQRAQNFKPIDGPDGRVIQQSTAQEAAKPVEKKSVAEVEEAIPVISEISEINAMASEEVVLPDSPTDKNDDSAIIADLKDGMDAKEAAKKHGIHWKKAEKIAKEISNQ